MARTVAEAFQIFHSRLTPLGGESGAAARHRASIEACLRANFGLTSFFLSGSFGNGTSVRRYSDVDRMAVIPTVSLHRDSNRTLTLVRAALANRFANTHVRVNAPAVKLEFGLDGTETTEVTPSDYMPLTSRQIGTHVYEIPDRDGGWMRTSPRAHNSYVQKANQRLSYRVKPLIRLIKSWKYYNSVPIRSFYLEIFIARWSLNEPMILYDIDILNVFRSLRARDCAAINDPTGISGRIYPCGTWIQKEGIIAKLEIAIQRAQKAVELQQQGRQYEAIYYWDLIFGGGFPAYG